MTNKQKVQIAEYRSQGYGYTQISKMMDLSISCVRTYCKRHGLGGELGYMAPVPSGKYVCENCGRTVAQNPGRKLKRFCSDRCRNQWWNAHQDQVNKKAIYEYTCSFCGKPFMAYGNANRKYCSHECYIEDRFGGGQS